MRVNMKWKSLLVASLLMVSFMGVAQQYGGTLRVADMAEPPSLNMLQTAADAAFKLVNYNITEHLFRIDGDGQLVNHLARDWGVVEVEGGAEYTFYLREGVYFHDGTELTAADVKFTFDMLLDPEIAAPSRAPFAFVKEIIEVDRYTVKFVTEGLGGPLIDQLASGKGAGIIPAGADMDRQGSHPIGTGPFKFAEWREGYSITLERFEDYWQEGLPYLDRVVVKYIPDEAARMSALLAGEVDMVYRMIAENALVVMETPGFVVDAGPTNLVQLVALNHERPPFDDVRVRRALYHATDRYEVIEGVMMRPDWGVPVGSEMCPPSPYYIDLSGMYPYNPELARQLLADAGFPDGFKITMYLPEPYEPHRRAGELVAAQWARVGVEVDLEILEWGRWLQKVHREADYDTTVIGHGHALEPSGRFSTRFERIDEEGRSTDYWRFTSEFLRELVARGRETVDFAEKMGIYAAVQTYIAMEVAAIWIQEMGALMAMNENVGGYRHLGMPIDDFQAIYWKGN